MLARHEQQRQLHRRCGQPTGGPPQRAAYCERPDRQPARGGRPERAVGRWQFHTRQPQSQRRLGVVAEWFADRGAGRQRRHHRAERRQGACGPTPPCRAASISTMAQRSMSPGLSDVELPISDILVTIPLIGANELANSPLLRNGFLNGLKKCRHRQHPVGHQCRRQCLGRQSDPQRSGLRAAYSAHHRPAPDQWRRDHAERRAGDDRGGFIAQSRWRLRPLPRRHGQHHAPDRCQLAKSSISARPIPMCRSSARLDNSRSIIRIGT